MSSLVVSGDTSGSVTLQAPAVSGTTVLTLPATSGTVLTTASGNAVSATTATTATTATSATTATNLAGGVAGAVPYQSGSGATGFSAAGTSGQLLQSNGVSAPSWVTASASAMVFLSTVTASNSATVNIETTFNSTYDQYIVQAFGITFQTNGDSLNARLKIGGSYLTTSTYYSHTANCLSSSINYSASNSTAQSSMMIASDVGTTAGFNTEFTLTIFNPTGTTFKKSCYWIGKTDTASSIEMRTISGAGMNSGTDALTGIRFFAPSGNIVAGTFRLYGIAKS